MYELNIPGQLQIIGDATMQFDKTTEWNGESKPANTAFQTTGTGIISFPVTDVSGAIEEKIESSVTINQL
jgi:hypothetical protein